MYMMFYNFKDPVVVNRGKWCSHKFTKDSNYMRPTVLLKDHKAKFVCTCGVKRVKAEAFKCRINTLKKLKFIFVAFQFKSL